MNEQLTAVIDDLIREKTFSLDGVEAIKRLRDRAAALEGDLKKSADQCAAAEKRVASLYSENEGLKAREQGVAKRENDVSAREAKITALEKSTAVAEARSDTMNNVFSTIFRNTIVRESISRQVAQPSGGYLTPANESLHRETE